MPTYIPKADELKRKWYLIDAKDQVLGKLAAAAAKILTGKRKPIYTPFLDTGDHLIVINAATFSSPAGRNRPSSIDTTRATWVASRPWLPATFARRHRGSWSRKPSAGCCRRPSWAEPCLASSRSMRETGIPTRHRSLKWSPSAEGSER